MPPEEAPQEYSLPHDLPASESFLPGPPWWLYASIGLGIFLVIALISFFLIRHFRKPKLVPSPPEDHISFAQKVLSQINQERPLGEVAAECSLTLRGCLHRIYREPVLFETDEEIKLRSNSLEKISEPLRTDLIELLEKLAEQKYAPSQISQAKAEEWIEKCHDAFRQLKKLLHSPSSENESSPH